jgi:hypothetical protein
MTQSAPNQDEGGEAEISLGLAAASREKQEIDRLAIIVLGRHEAPKFHRMKASRNGYQRGSSPGRAERLRRRCLKALSRSISGVDELTR